MKQNIDGVGRVLRFALAFWLLGPFAPQFTAGWANWLILIIGLIVLIESFTGYCYINKWLGINK